MILFKTAADLARYLADKSKKDKTIGFVPTMGALHKGHLSLIDYSKKNTGITVCSIFVNPTQFNDPNDFAKYPVTLEKDLLLLENAGCDVVFIPSVEEIYPAGMHQNHFNIGYLENILEGKYRPGHFQGVCQVVHRLLEIVKPTILFLGRKDYQQCMVIKKMITISGWGIELFIVPIIREDAGLAMSSRNSRLSEKDRQSATAIYRSLQYLARVLQPGNHDKHINAAISMLTAAGFEKIDYVTIAHADTLENISVWDVIGLVAAFISGVRLIDNIQLH
jgi:pantoate--beta-alanine ligase